MSKQTCGESFHQALFNGNGIKTLLALQILLTQHLIKKIFHTCSTPLSTGNRTRILQKVPGLIWP